MGHVARTHARSVRDTRAAKRCLDGGRAARFSSRRDFGHNVLAMNVESRDSVSLKPAELDEFSQLLTSNGLALNDAQLDLQVEAFPLAVVAMLDR